MEILLRKILICAAFWVSVVANGVVDETDPAYWKRVAQEELKHAQRMSRRNNNVAKNTIIFIGDGMGFPTITAGRIMKGQQMGQSGEEYKLAIDKFPHTATSKVYCVDHQVPDSASTATAIFCGVKTNEGVVGLNAKAKANNCSSARGNEVQSVLIDAFNAGKSTGVITTTTIVHGTPAAAYAHTPYREWYSDKDMPQSAKDEGCTDIAAQFLEVSDKITVMLGGGRQHFKPSTTRDPENNVTNDRMDGRDLIEEWQQNAHGENRQYVTNLSELKSVNAATTDRLLGLFEHSHMPLEFERNRTTDPSLTEMTEKALEILTKNPKGYLLIVEGGRIDHMHHLNLAGAGLRELVAFDDAVNSTMQKLSESSDTLVIVTADHGHVLAHGGDMDRGANILGLSSLYTLDRKPFTALTYGNGPGYHESIPNYQQLLNPFRKLSAEREDLTNVDTAGLYVFQTAVPTLLETHSGTDVPIFASGPKSHLFHGVHEQNYIAHVIRYASEFSSTEEELEQKKETAAKKQLSNLRKLCDHLFY